MKKRITLALTAALLAVALAFAGCVSQEPVPTTQPSTEAPTVPPTDPPTEAPTEPPTQAPTDPPPTNPLTGEVLEAPLENRVVAVTINNVPKALPHYGVNEADLFFEMFVNDYATRGLALYTDITRVPQVGSVRSLRYNFTDIGLSYDAIVCHSGGSDSVLSDARTSGVDHLKIDTSTSTGYSFRDFDRRSAGYSWEHCLFARGEGIYDYAAASGMGTAMDPGRDFGLRFAEDGTPDGDSAAAVSITFNHKGSKKNSSFDYDPETGWYLFSQYGDPMVDGATGERERFRNVIVILTSVTNKAAGNNVYHVADLDGSGSGYYACGGRLIPIVWSRSGDGPFVFTHEDGTALEMGVGSSYIAIAPTASTVSWE